MAVRTYDPKQVAVLVSGVPMSGFADGTFISVERDEDAFSKVSGADGIVSRAKSNNSMGTLTLTLAQTSPSNDVLSALATLDELTNAGIFPIIVKDNSGRSIHFSSNAWVKKVPAAGYAKEVGNREWIFDLADYSPFIGGNSTFDGQL